MLGNEQADEPFLHWYIAGEMVSIDRYQGEVHQISSTSQQTILGFVLDYTDT